MKRYERWANNQYALLNKLRQTRLFADRLLPDIQKGDVFPAFRKHKIDFYHVGRKLFSFDGRGFQSNIAYLVALQDRPKGEVKETDFKTLKLCESFYDGYSQIKNNTRLYIEEESEQVSAIWNKHSCCAHETGPIVVLDIELSLEAQDDDRFADRIDLILFDKDSRRLRFFEVKTFRNKELKPVEGHVAVLDQIKRYTQQVRMRHNSMLSDYSQYVTLLNHLYGCSLPTPNSIDEAVDLLVFDFNAEQEQVLERNVIPLLIEQCHCIKRGKAKGASQGTLKSWWKRK